LRALSRFFHRYPRLRLAGLLGAPMAWMTVAYLASLGALLITALYRIDPFTFSVVEEIGFDNFKTVLTKSVYRSILLRTVGIALAVTVVCALIAVPLAFTMAKLAPVRWRRFLVISVVLPLWASYLVKNYAMRALLSKGGFFDWAFGTTIGLGKITTIITLSYLWLPYMIIPVYSGFERLPDSLLEASSDLGAKASSTFRHVIVPALIPSIVAGSIFTFSLSLGDYIAVTLVGGQTQMVGNVIFREFGANNIPLAASFAILPVVVVIGYLMAVRRTGAFDNL
jgi:putative spermidine/putrescine transport system permease protein